MKNRTDIEFIKLEADFTICKILDLNELNFDSDFIFLSKTDDEISLVCESDKAPQNCIAADRGWKALKIVGMLEFEMIGVIAGITCVLAEANISVFVVSTYNTDYILLKCHDFEKSIELLKENGYAIKDQGGLRAHNPNTS